MQSYKLYIIMFTAGFRFNTVFDRLGSKKLPLHYLRKEIKAQCDCGSCKETIGLFHLRTLKDSASMRNPASVCVHDDKQGEADSAADTCSFVKTC